MTSAPANPSRPPRQPAEKSTLAVPLTVWLLIQLAALALAASRLPLSAHFARPPQSLALDEMLIAQFVGAALFFPLLFRGWRAWLAMAVSAWPMLMLASTMTAIPAWRVTALWLLPVQWLTALALWRLAAPHRGDVVAAVALMGSAGGLLLAYLQAEFGPSTWGRALDFMPLASLVRHLADPTLFAAPFLSTGAFAAVAAAVLAFNAHKDRRETTTG